MEQYITVMTTCHNLKYKWGVYDIAYEKYMIVMALV